MLADIDEMVMSCRSPRARLYVAEAVAAYKAGAYRSAIVSTWIAFVFDFMDKLRELEVGGDKRAAKKLEEIRVFEGRFDPAAIESSQRFEREVVDLCEKDYELISAIQRVDLERLKEDRNRCAHPSLISSELPYSPSAELARYHLSNLVVHVLSQPPVQGRAALEGLFADVKSKTFPGDEERAIAYFRDGPLGRASHPLVRNFVVATLDLAITSQDAQERKRASVALKAVRVLYTQWLEDAIKEKISSKVRSLPDEGLIPALLLVRRIPSCYSWLDRAGQLRLEGVLQNPPEGQEDQITLLCLRIPELELDAISLLPRVSDEAVLRRIEKDGVHEAVVSELVRRYCESVSFWDANRWTRKMGRAVIAKFRDEDLERISRDIVLNRQVKESTSAPGFVANVIRESVGGTEEMWMSLVTNWGTNLSKSDREKILDAVKLRFDVGSEQEGNEDGENGPTQQEFV